MEMHPSGVETNFDDVGHRLDPWQLVRVVLVGAHEDDRPLRRWDVTRQVELAFERFGDADAEHADQLVDRCCRARTDEKHHVVGAGVDRSRERRRARLLAQVGSSPVRWRRLRCACCRSSGRTWESQASTKWRKRPVAVRSA